MLFTNLCAGSRGLDYYTGVIYEVILVGENVGAIAAGGRYGMLMSHLPCAFEFAPSICVNGLDAAH